MGNCAINVFWFSHIPPPFPCFGSYLVYQFFKDSVKVVINSNLQSLFYEAAYTFDNFKEPLDANVVDSPMSKQSSAPHHPCSHSKGSHVRAIVSKNPPSQSRCVMAPHQQFHMDVWLTLDATIPITPCDLLPSRADSALIVTHSKVHYSHHQISFPFPCLSIPFVQPRLRPSSSN